MKRDGWLVRLYESVYSRHRLAIFLRGLGIFSTAVVILLYAYAFGVLLFFGEFVSALRLGIFVGVPFFIVCTLRRIVDSPRPYEVYDIHALASLKAFCASGRSFPSLHIFFAFLIGILWMIYSVPLGLVGIFFGLCIALERILLGRHFPKDVLSGAVIGIMSGLVGMLIW